MSKTVVRTDVERELEETKKKARDTFSKKIIAKALYIPYLESPYLRFEKLERYEEGRVDDIVIRKTNDEQIYVIPEDNLKAIEEFKDSVGFDRGITFTDLMYLGDVSYGRNDFLLQTSMEVLEELEKEKILVIDREKHELHQNVELTSEEFESFLTKTRLENTVFMAVGRKLSKGLSGLKRD